MSNNYYRIVNVEGRESIAFGFNGEYLTVLQSNPRYDGIRTALLDNDYEAAYELYDAAQGIANKFERVSDRVTLRGQTLYFDGDAVDNLLTRTILRFHEEGKDFKPLVNFLEKLYVNNEPQVREFLYKWVADRNLTITEDGDVVGYKGVYRTDDGFKSTASGRATVNGVEHAGQIPQSVGDVVEMPRSEVTHDPNLTCSHGLHIGTHAYAKAYGDTQVRVSFNPRDVVSVPRDAGGAKIRVCRYTLLEDCGDEVESALYETQPVRVQSVRVYCYRVPSATKAGVNYTVEWDVNSGIRGCTCPSWKYRKACKHADAVATGNHMWSDSYVETNEVEAEAEAEASVELKAGDTIYSRKGVRYTVSGVGRSAVTVQDSAGTMLTVKRVNLPKSFKVTKAQAGL